MVGDLETTRGYISEVKGGSMFVASCCLMFNFHPKLDMTPISCLKSLGQNEKELQFITIPQKSSQFKMFWGCLQQCSREKTNAGVLYPLHD